jgi:hypothetical protein
LKENTLFNDFPMTFRRQHDNTLLSTRGAINKTGILDPIKFWCVP